MIVLVEQVFFTAVFKTLSQLLRCRAKGSKDKLVQ